MTMRTIRKNLLAVLASCVCTLLSLPSFADGVVLSESGTDRRYTNEEAGVMVRPFAGPKAETVHQAVIRALESAGVILIPAGFEEDVKLGEQPGPYVQVADKVGIKAYVHGRTSMSKQGWSLNLRVRNGKDGRIVAEPRLAAGWLPGLLKKIDVEVMGVLEKPLAETSLPPSALEGGGDSDTSSEPGVEQVTLVADTSDTSGPVDEPPRKSAARGPSAPPSPFDARIGAGLIQRTLQYNKAVGDIYENGLQPHQFAAPALALSVRWYPGAHFFEGPLAHIGITGDLYQTFQGSTEVGAGANAFATTFTELNLGFRGRIQLTTDLELGLNGGWGFQSMVMEGDNLALLGGERGDPGVIPDLEYTYYRFGPDVSFELGLPVELGVFYRTLTLSNEDGYFAEDRWFPEAAGIGLEAYLTVAIELSDDFELELGGIMRHYGIDANSGPFEDNVEPNGNVYLVGEPGLTEAVAAGASDTYFGGVVGVHYTLPGEG